MIPVKRYSSILHTLGYLGFEGIVGCEWVQIKGGSHQNFYFFSNDILNIVSIQQDIDSFL